MYLHIDMDYFFAQLEEKRRPMMKGKIIIVCVYSGRTADSGVVSTVNYPGRELGIRSGMPIAFAKRRAPPADSIFLPVDHEYYSGMSERIDGAIRGMMEKVVQASIDEWNVEDADSAGKAPALKKRILDEFGLRCSVGVAPSLLGAKMAASKSKPDGLLVLDGPSERKMISGSNVEKVPGIGPKTAQAPTPPINKPARSSNHEGRLIPPSAGASAAISSAGCASAAGAGSAAVSPSAGARGSTATPAAINCPASWMSE